MKTPLVLAAFALTATSLVACSTEAEMRGVDPDAQHSAEPGTAVDGDLDVVRTRVVVTVLDAGEGAQLCLGGVAESFPPQCSGLPMTGWDWAEHREHDEAGGVRWGEFALTGTFDGTTFAVTEATPGAEAEQPEPDPEEPLGTPCAEVGAGNDPAKTTPEALDATLIAAAALPDLAMTWLDGEVINVAVTEDVEGARTVLTKTWGGPLCVSEAEHTERELQEIQVELNELPGFLTSGSLRPDQIEVTVVYDDGSIQQQVDAEYGADLVVVNSALVHLDED